MAKVDVLYHCGCGFQTRDQAIAENHCDTTYHDLSVNGIIKSTTRPPDWPHMKHQQKQFQKRAAKVSSSSNRAPIEPIDYSDYDRLRARLRSRGS